MNGSVKRTSIYTIILSDEEAELLKEFFMVLSLEDVSKILNPKSNWDKGEYKLVITDRMKETAEVISSLWSILEELR